jgi:hypothetical protein
MLIRRGFVAVLAASAVGCATESGYKDVLDSYVGSPEAALLAQWGPPDQAYSSDPDTKYLTFSRSRTGYVPGVPPTYQTSCNSGFCTTIPVGGSPGFSYTNSCRTFFKVVHGTIEAWGFTGNACRA